MDLGGLFFPELERNVAAIAAAEGQEPTALRAMGKTLAAAFAAVLQGSGLGGTTAHTRPVLEADWAVGVSVDSTLGSAFTVNDTSANGSVSIATSMEIVYADAPVVFTTGANAGVRSSIKSISTGNIATITLNDFLTSPPAQGDRFVVYARPSGVDQTGATRAQTTQVYVGMTTAAVPAGSVAAVTVSEQYRPIGMGVEMHRGQVFLISAKGYAYTIQAQMVLQMAGIDPVAQSPVVPTTPGFGGWQSFGVNPPAVSNVLNLIVTPKVVGALDDTLTLLWFIDANDTAIDQDPSGAHPLQVSTLPVTISGATARNTALATGTKLFSPDYSVPANGFVLVGISIQTGGATSAIQVSRDGGTNWDELLVGKQITAGQEYDLALPVGSGDAWNLAFVSATTLGLLRAMFVRSLE